jgi:mRNA interferase MazF
VLRLIKNLWMLTGRTMKTKQWSIYLVNLDPRVITKPGKIRPCLVLRPDVFSALTSTVIVPFTSKLVEDVEDFYPLRIRIPQEVAGLDKTSDILIDQMIAWPNEAFIEEIGPLPEAFQLLVKRAVKEFLDLN